MSVSPEREQVQIPSPRELATRLRSEEKTVGDDCVTGGLK